MNTELIYDKLMNNYLLIYILIVIIIIYSIYLINIFTCPF